MVNVNLTDHETSKIFTALKTFDDVKIDSRDGYIKVCRRKTFRTAFYNSTKMLGDIVKIMSNLGFNVKPLNHGQYFSEDLKDFWLVTFTVSRKKKS